MNQTAILSDRGVIRLHGPDARSFLQGLVTCDMDAVEPGKTAFGGILSPQGKILFDFQVHADIDGFLIDCRADILGELVKRLTFYKLRAQVELEDVSTSYGVIAAWGGSDPVSSEQFANDPRLTELGQRGIAATETDIPATASLADYHTHRIALGVPEGGLDFTFGDTFPHETDMDQLHGVSFSKGCYVGQEVVSRIENRGTARTRTILALSEEKMPPAGTNIEAGEKTIGTLGSSAQGKAIAIVRLDRVENARESGDIFTANGIPLELIIPEWTDF